VVWRSQTTTISLAKGLERLARKMSGQRLVGAALVAARGLWRGILQAPLPPPPGQPIAQSGCKPL